MNDIAVLALVVGGTSILGPIVNRILSADDRKRFNARQDDVAKQVREAAALLVIANREIVGQAKGVNEKLDTIHTLVNSNFTAALQGEYDSTARELASLKAQIILLNKSKAEVPEDIKVAIQLAEARLAELKAEITDRLKQ